VGQVEPTQILADQIRLGEIQSFEVLIRVKANELCKFYKIVTVGTD
jgi:hypothetical protein